MVAREEGHCLLKPQGGQDLGYKRKELNSKELKQKRKEGRKEWKGGNWLS